MDAIQKFDWEHFINIPLPTKEEFEEAKQEASGWQTCATGCIDHVKKDSSGTPIDIQLFFLGLDFSNKLDHMLHNKESMQSLREVYIEIKERAQAIRFSE